MISQAAEIDSSFMIYIEAARILTPLAFEFRYPGDYVEPEEYEYREAYEASKSIFQFVLQKLHPVIHL